MAIFGSTAFYSRCVGNVTGINASSYTADGSVEQTKTPNECGDNVKIITKNAMVSHTWEGEITGASPGGVVTANLGQSLSPPGGIYNGNLQSPGSSLICTRTSYNESRGEWATFSVTGENNEGV